MTIFFSDNSSKYLKNIHFSRYSVWFLNGEKDSKDFISFYATAAKTSNPQDPLPTATTVVNNIFHYHFSVTRQQSNELTIESNKTAKKIN